MNTCQSIQDETVKHVGKNIEKLQKQLKSVKEDFECKHQELQNLMRIQENLTRRNDLPVDGTAESLIKN